MFKKIVLAAAASTMALSGVAHASAAQSLSLKNVRASTATAKSGKSNQAAGSISPLFIVGGIIAVVAILEVTGAINIFGDDEPDSP